MLCNRVKMAHAVNIPHTTERTSAGKSLIPTYRKRNRVHKKPTKKAKIISEIKAERFIFRFLTYFFVVILEKVEKI